MTTILKKFEDEITNLFKAYRMAHFSIYNMKTTFYNFKCSHPNLENFILEDRDFDSEVKFNEKEIQKNSEDGLYQRIIAGNTIAMFYNIWEDKYRGIIAKNIGCKKNEIKLCIQSNKRTFYYSYNTSFFAIYFCANGSNGSTAHDP